MYLCGGCLVLLPPHRKAISEISHSSIISGDYDLCSYSSIGYLGEDSLITLQTCWMVALHAWDQDHSYHWTIVHKAKSENVSVMAKSGVSNASHSPDQPYLSKQLTCSASTHLI